MEERDVNKDIEAIEKEKEEFLEGDLNEESDEGSEDDDSEATEEEEIEFSLTDDDINEWISELTQLKEEKNPIELSVDEETKLKINFDDSSDEGSEESNGTEE